MGTALGRLCPWDDTGISAVAAGNHGHSEADLRYTARRYFTIDGARATAIQLADATFAARDPGIWGQSTTTVASDSTHFRACDQNLSTEWHSRYGGGGGVLIYWHVEKNSMVVRSQLISCAASEVAAMVEGAMRHGTSMALEGNTRTASRRSGSRSRGCWTSICCRGSSTSTRPSCTGPTAASPTRIPA